jgi:hypothetical protein
MPRLSKETWADIRAEREAGASFGDLAAKFGVDRAAIHRRAKTEGWSDGQDVAEIIRRKVNEKVNAISTAGDPQKRAEAIDTAAEKGASVVRTHQSEWEDHRERFGSVPEDLEAGKLAKISAEMLRIRQDGERKAWGLDSGQTQGDVVLHHNLRIVGDND